MKQIEKMVAERVCGKPLAAGWHLGEDPRHLSSLQASMRAVVEALGEPEVADAIFEELEEHTLLRVVPVPGLAEDLQSALVEFLTADVECPGDDSCVLPEHWADPAAPGPHRDILAEVPAPVRPVDGGVLVAVP